MIRVLMHYYADDDHTAKHVYLGEARALRPTSTARAVACTGAWRSSSPQRVGRIPVYPAAGGYALPEDVALLASNESPEPPLPQVRRGDRSARSAGLNRYPDPTNAQLRRALADRYGVPPRADRDRQRLVRHPAAAGEALLEPGAELVYAWPSFSVYPHLAAASGARAIEVPLNDRRTSTTSTRWLAEITVATRLVIVCNPNNPTSTALPLDRDRGVRRACAAPRLRDRRRGLLRVQHARRPGRVARPARATTRTSSCCGRSRRSTGSCGLRVGYGLCGSDALRHGGRPGAPAVLLQRRRPGRGDRGAQAPGRGRRARRARDRRAASSSRTGCSGSASSRPTSQANFCWFDLRADDDGEETVVAACRARVLVRAGTRSAAAGVRVTSAPPRERRFLATPARRSTRSPTARRGRTAPLRSTRWRACSSVMRRARDGLSPPALAAPSLPALSGYAYAWRFS